MVKVSFVSERLDIFVSLNINYIAHTVHDPFGKNYMSFPLISSCSVRALFPHTGSFRYHSAYVSTYRYISIPFLQGMFLCGNKKKSYIQFKRQVLKAFNLQPCSYSHKRSCLKKKRHNALWSSRKFKFWNQSKEKKKK